MKFKFQLQETFKIVIADIVRKMQLQKLFSQIDFNLRLQKWSDWVKPFYT